MLATLTPRVNRPPRNRGRPRGAVLRESTRCTRAELAIGNRRGASCLALRYLVAASVEVDEMTPMTVEVHLSRPSETNLLTYSYTRGRRRACGGGGIRVAPLSHAPCLILDHIWTFRPSGRFPRPQAFCLSCQVSMAGDVRVLEGGTIVVDVAREEQARIR